MDILGKKGEEAFENVEDVSQELQNLSSHLDAVDSALQDFMQQSQQLLHQEHGLEESDIRELEDIADRVSSEDREIDTLYDRIEELQELQRSNERRIDKLFSSDMMQYLEDMNTAVKSIRKSVSNLRSDIRDIEERVNELENNFVLEVNKRDYDFEQKLDESEYRSREKKIMNEINKLRASVNVLAEDLDRKNDIEID
ncbi:MAG: hypothetical protein ABEI58_01085 [Candidatus Nanohaloarchaea archaeon]